MPSHKPEARKCLGSALPNAFFCLPDRGANTGDLPSIIVQWACYRRSLFDALKGWLAMVSAA
jgi:hypothetical protein